MNEKNDSTIKICMGSSCFARGNSENLQLIEKFLSEHNLEIEIELTGSRCENKCIEGPNIIINGKTYNSITTDRLEKLLSQEFLVGTSLG